MSLTLGNVSGSAQWLFQKANAGFSNTKQSGQLIGNVDYDPTVINKGYIKTQTIAIGANQDFDLTSLTDPVGDTVNMTKAAGFVITATGGACKVKAGATNGLSSWFVQDSGSLYIQSGGFAVIGWTGGTAATVSGTAKVINIAQAGATAVTVSVAILGG